MELYQLRSFLRVAAEGSFTRAGEALHLSQPAVTQHVGALERELGTALFERTGRGVRLTPAGEALAQAARGSLALLEEGRQRIADLSAGLSGRLLLGAGVTTSVFQLPGWLRAFREAYPGIEVVVRTGRSREVATLALDREIDLGIVTSPVGHEELVARPLYDEAIHLVAPPGDPLAGREVPLAKLERAPLILFSRGSGFRDYLDRSLSVAGVVPRVKMESDSVEAIKSFVAVGLGLSFLPAAAVAGEIDTGALALLRVRDLPPLSRTTSVLYRRDRILGPGARGFLTVLEERFGRSEG
jgi:DNA-binding transcriptional LysR family regulator